MTTDSLILQARLEIQHLRESTKYSIMTYWWGSAQKHIQLSFQFTMLTGEQYASLNRELADAYQVWNNRYLIKTDEVEEIV